MIIPVEMIIPSFDTVVLIPTPLTQRMAGLSWIESNSAGSVFGQGHA